MKKYRVYAKYVTRCYLDVEANSEEEAYEKAEEADGGDFEMGVDRDWQSEMSWDYYDCEVIEE